MEIKNLTNPERTDNFENNDLIQYTHDSGAIEIKHYHIIEKTLEEKIFEEKLWRDDELKESDYIVPLTDHPQQAAYMTYRQELRDYPMQADFPNGERPVKP